MPGRSEVGGLWCPCSWVSSILAPERVGNDQPICFWRYPQSKDAFGELSRGCQRRYQRSVLVCTHPDWRRSGEAPAGQLLEVRSGGRSDGRAGAARSVAARVVRKFDLNEHLCHGSARDPQDRLPLQHRRRLHQCSSKAELEAQTPERGPGTCVYAGRRAGCGNYACRVLQIEPPPVKHHLDLVDIGPNVVEVCTKVLIIG